MIRRYACRCTRRPCRRRQDRSARSNGSRKARSGRITGPLFHPSRKRLPRGATRRWARQPMDRFILARLETGELAPSPEADKAALLRRVSLDLTGLAADAGRSWRPFWPTRRRTPMRSRSIVCWLRRAMANAGRRCGWTLRVMPTARVLKRTSRSVVWPVSRLGDRGVQSEPPLRPVRDHPDRGRSVARTPRFEDRIATAFHRQTAANDEGGTDDEEYPAAAVMDRVATTWSVLNGVTMNCVQCHSHPYDPIRHDEYYKFLAFFNTSRDADLPSTILPSCVCRETNRASELCGCRSRQLAAKRTVKRQRTGRR